MPGGIKVDVEEEKVPGVGNKTLFWDCTAGVYDLFVNIINARTQEALRRETAALFEPEDFVLECGCGTGMLTEVIAPRCRELIATDFSKKMLQKAEAKCGAHNNINFMLADIMRLDFADSSFDKVIAANVIHLLENPRDALKELERVCRLRGKIILPTYMDRCAGAKENRFINVLGKAGAGFKEKFTFFSYRQFFNDVGYPDAQFIDIEGFIPCCVAVIEKTCDRLVECKNYDEE